MNELSGSSPVPQSALRPTACGLANEYAVGVPRPQKMLGTNRVTAHVTRDIRLFGDQSPDFAKLQRLAGGARLPQTRPWQWQSLTLPREICPIEAECPSVDGGGKTSPTGFGYNRTPRLACSFPIS